MPIDSAAWSCPDCNETFRSPPGWPVYVWAGARRAAQVLHAKKHGRSALIENRRRLTDPPIDYGPRGPAHTVIDTEQ
jgi:hypothetical protein